VQVFGLPLPLTFPCEFRLAESQKPTKVVYQVDGLVKGTLQWNLQPSGKQTLVSGSASYQMGLGQALNETTSKASSATGGLLGGLTGGLTSGVASTVGGVVNSVTGILPLLTSVNEGNFNTMLTNLKVIGENLRA
jgi:predicted lipid-binding transport protein (Tim44 family)